MLEDKASQVSDQFLSVVIPVYNDAGALQRCLAALEKQTYPKESFEVVVVDNNSDDDIDSIVHKYPQAVLADEKQPGSYAARNKGLSVARGDIVAFTDSDCIPAADWIEKGVSNFLRIDNCGLVAGKINLTFRNADRLTPVELYESLTAFDQKNKVESFRHGVTANLFTHRSVFEKVGLFDSKLKSGGDVEWGKRVYHYGYRQIYAHDCCVQHPARQNLKQLFKKVTRVESGVYTWKYTNGYSILDTLKDLIKLTLKTLGLLRRNCFKKSPTEKLEQNRQKIQYLLVTVFVGLVRIFERIRLKDGHAPQR